MKRKEGTEEGEGTKKARGESSGYRPLMIASVGEHCEGCGIPRHKRETCHLREHPDFNKEGKWVNCSSYKKKKALNASKGVGEEHPMLKWSEYAGGGALADPKYNGSRREREKAAERLEQSGKPSERRRADDSRGGIYGVARQSVPEADGSKPREVRFEDKGARGPRGGTPRLSATTATASCDCDDIDVDMTYRMCCLTVGSSPSYKAATLFDTGAHASFVNREVAAWVEGQARRNPSYLQKAREGQDQRCTTVSLAGTAYSSPI